MGDDKDKNLDEIIPGSGNLSSLYEHGKREEPPATIDNHILQSARNAVSEKKGAGTGPFSGSWQIPAALAAVLILAIGLTVTMEKFPGTGQNQVERFAPGSDMSSPVEQAADQKKTAKPQPKIELKAKRQQVQTGEPPAASPVGNAAPASPSAESVEQGDKAGALKTVPTTEPKMSVGKETKQETLDTEEQSGDTGKPLQQEAQPTAEKWLASIRELVRQEKLEEARKQLSDFRRVYPEYTLPEDLKHLDR